MSFRRNPILVLIAAVSLAGSLHAADKLKVLLIDGQNNHDWRHTTPVLKWILEDSGRFTVDVSTTPGNAPRPPQAPKADAKDDVKAAYEAAKKKFDEGRDAALAAHADAWKNWRPKFKDYAVVVSNYNGDSWPEDVRKDFVEYVKGGGGFVSVHAADNSFPDWPEYNEMIGLGGWGGRSEKSGPYVYYKDDKVFRDESAGGGGTHGKFHEFVIDVREPEHPIMKGLPAKWKHAADELYGKLRGPGKNLTILATSFADPLNGGTSRHEPLLMTTTFGTGRCFHTALGHGVSTLSGLGFQITLLRGTEWAATGAVTIPAPAAESLPADKAALREPPKQ
jgi:type 1 glutamine amidotransferase